MVKIREAIVVEGKYDKNVLHQIVDAPIFVTNGFGIFKDPDTMTLLRRTAEKRGLIVLTDSDGAGFVIRNRIKSSIPGKYLKHAYIPDIPGKEKRKSAPGKEGKLGVEGMRPEVLLEALRRCGATFQGEEAPVRSAELTKADMMEKGLVGPGSAARRQQVLKELELPEHLTANGLLEAMNLLLNREEFDRL